MIQQLISKKYKIIKKATQRVAFINKNNFTKKQTLNQIAFAIWTISLYRMKK